MCMCACNSNLLGPIRFVTDGLSIRQFFSSYHFKLINYEGVGMCMCSVIKFYSLVFLNVNVHVQMYSNLLGGWVVKKNFS